MAGYTRQSSGSIITGAVIEAAHFNNEYNALEAAFSGSTGHAHDGTSGSGPKIVLTAAAGISGTLPVANGGTGSTTAAAARTALGLAIGTDVQAWDVNLDQIAALAVTDSNFIVGNGTAWVAETGATARTSLGLGSLATANTINGSNWSGTDLAVADGGTGSSTAADARTALGLTIGTNVQAWDADLDTIAALAKTDSNFIVADGLAWTVESGATARTSLGLAIGTNVQAWDANLDQIAALAITDSNFIVGNGTAWVAESGATARTSLGVAIGTNVQAWDANLDEIAALLVTDGNFIVGNGTAWVAESGATARTSLGLGTLATLSSVATANIDADAVTFAKMQNISTARLLGRSTAASGDIEEISIGSGLTLSAGSLSNSQTQKIVQVVNTQTGVAATGTTTIPLDNTIPQNTEGTEFMTLAITPTSATNKLKIEVTAQVSPSLNSVLVTGALFQDATASALAAVFSGRHESSAEGGAPMSFVHFMTAGTTSATTFKFRAGGSAASTITFNGNGSAGKLGGVIASSITITEISV